MKAISVCVCVCVQDCTCMPTAVMSNVILAAPFNKAHNRPAHEDSQGGSSCRPARGRTADCLSKRASTN